MPCNDALAKHLEYENTQKRIVTCFFSICPFKKRNAPKCFKPVLTWLTVRYAPASNLSFNFLNHISLSLYGLPGGGGGGGTAIYGLYWYVPL